MAQDAPQPIVRLNVGGTIFSTSVETLAQPTGTMLAAMFGGGFNNRQDEQGAVFIDRDPKHFPRVLNYLRDGVCTLPENRDEKLELLREASFYGLEGLTTELEAATGGLVSGLQHRILASVFARRELEIVKDFILRVGFDDGYFTPGHLLGVAVCLSCTPDFIKARSSAGMEANELIVPAQDKSRHEEAAQAIRFCCQNHWVLPSYMETWKLGLKVIEVEPQILSQACCLTICLSWTHCQVMPASSTVSAHHVRMKGTAQIGRYGK
ncbi:BTB/POZ protein [Dunaliella salina]|uniref:BTB/POZ protein n=1 Tax=Dunaliella salina TaxID=3046 RepID=A0ABQ7H0E2_DUNSA|nr:BTB/POZ protein [Dunaliella salina]|eukprot:KAF5840327.1 BTB/POZ protein [Dunaliella salina]